NNGRFFFAWHQVLAPQEERFLLLRNQNCEMPEDRHLRMALPDVLTTVKANVCAWHSRLKLLDARPLRRRGRLRQAAEVQELTLRNHEIRVSSPHSGMTLEMSVAIARVQRAVGQSFEGLVRDGIDRFTDWQQSRSVPCLLIRAPTPAHPLVYRCLPLRAASFVFRRGAGSPRLSG